MTFCNWLKEKEDLAPRARFELATLRLTAECSTVELPGIWMAISSDCSKLRRVLFNRLDVQLGQTGHNKAKSYPLGPFASVLHIVLQLLRVFVRDAFTRMAYPELLQVPGDSVFAKVRRAESAETVKAFDSEIVE